MSDQGAGDAMVVDADQAVDHKVKLKQRIVKFHEMITKGCGARACQVPSCASNPKSTVPESSQDALLLAIALVQRGAPLCPRVEAGRQAATLAENDQQPQNPANFLKIVAKARECGEKQPLIDFISSCLCTAADVDAAFGFDEPTPESSNIDFAVVRDAFSVMMDDGFAAFNEALINMSKGVGQSIMKSEEHRPLSFVRAVLILLECDLFLDPESRVGLRHLFASAFKLSSEESAAIVNWLTQYDQSSFERLLGIVQQYITMKWFTERRVSEIHPAVLFLALLNTANERANLVPFSEFYNEVVNSELDMRRDYTMWTETQQFCFARFPFLLDAACKSALLQADAQLQMRDQFDEALVRYLFSASRASMPFLVLSVNRDSIVEDTLKQVQDKSSRDFKKPLKVRFVGEEGVDEGGIQKEFFQLLTRELFDPKYGMFLVEEDSHLLWFNKDSFESKLEFELIGILLGLAIYNGVILDARFPLVVYKKLLGVAPTFEDLKDINPSMYKGLRHLLEFDDDVESTYHRSFTVEYSLFGEHKSVELKENGANIPLTNDNRQEYVNLFCDYTFNKSISAQFAYFKGGFELVCGGPPLQLFRPEELEMAVCGSRELDFEALEKAAKYENYTPDAPVIQNFWKIVHELDEQEKRRFLSFCTGTDRVPINGLGSLKVPFVIVRNGEDADRLPTSHTCFNTILLPNYSTYDRLKHYLMIAISNPEGFGLQ